MKSFSKVIRAGEQAAELQTWSPAELEKNETNSLELVQAADLDFFNLTGNRKNNDAQFSSKRLMKGEQKLQELQPWQPADFTHNSISSHQESTASWTPYLELNTPQKKATSLVEEARIRAEEIIVTAQRTVEEVRQESYEQGIESARAEMKEILQAAATLITVARDWRTDMMKHSEPMVIDLVKKMGQKMFGDGLVLDNTVLQRHFSDVLESARALDDLRIYMNPLDAEELGPDWREYQASVLGHKVDILSTESIKRGGCYIQGEWGTADALVETQLTTILRQFSEVEQPEKGDD